MRYNLLAAVLALLLLSPSLAADELDLLSYTHRSLDATGESDLSAYRGKPVVMLFFTSDCPWCHKQARILRSLQQHCSKQFTPVALGVGGDRNTLRRELHRMRVPFSGFITGSEMVNKMGGVPATPLMLITDKNGNFAHFQRGLLPEEQLKQVLCPT
ncbi:TlpA family protein disulfide reductase [Ferrimonas pelagia]|uniref:Conjugal transfer protein TraF n=1 Tax=Ferrimonas pelagia TaxID=1177826 RepID=A0ABP9F6E1_9GAMM